MADLREDELYNSTTGFDAKDSYNDLNSDVHEETYDTLITEHGKGKSLNGVVEAVFRVRVRRRGRWLLGSKETKFLPLSDRETCQCYMEIHVQCP